MEFECESQERVVHCGWYLIGAGTSCIRRFQGQWIFVRRRRFIICLFIRKPTMKKFTLEEAQSLLPVLESLLKRAMESKRAADELEAGRAELARRIYVSGGMKVDLGVVTRQR